MDFFFLFSLDKAIHSPEKIFNQEKTFYSHYTRVSLMKWVITVKSYDPPQHDYYTLQNTTDSIILSYIKDSIH